MEEEGSRDSTGRPEIDETNALHDDPSNIRSSEVKSSVSERKTRGQGSEEDEVLGTAF